MELYVHLRYNYYEHLGHTLSVFYRVNKHGKEQNCI